MNHTGVWGTGSRRQARRNAESCAGLVRGVGVIATMVPCFRRRASPVLSEGGGTVFPQLGSCSRDEEVAG